jgi:hypothetical protein
MKSQLSLTHPFIEPFTYDKEKHEPLQTDFIALGLGGLMVDGSCVVFAVSTVVFLCVVVVYVVVLTVSCLCVKLKTSTYLKLFNLLLFEVELVVVWLQVQ